jgi:hypothetical protein
VECGSLLPLFLFAPAAASTNNSGSKLPHSTRGRFDLPQALCGSHRVATPSQWRMLFKLLHRLVTFVAAVFLPLAAGALWSALSLRFSAELPGMALACAAATWPARHYLSRHSGLLRGTLSLLICAIGIAYAYWLKSASIIAATVGVGFFDAFLTIGADLAFAIAQARAHFSSPMFVVTALALAFWIGWRREPGEAALPSMAGTKA